MELSVHGLVTNASVTPEKVYAMGFYGDQVFYALGYVMARGVVEEQGKGAIRELISRPGAEFVLRYVPRKGMAKATICLLSVGRLSSWLDRSQHARLNQGSTSGRKPQR